MSCYSFLISTRPKGAVRVRTRVSKCRSSIETGTEREKIRNLGNGTAQPIVESNCWENGREIRLSWK